MRKILFAVLLILAFARFAEAQSSVSVNLGATYSNGSLTTELLPPQNGNVATTHTFLGANGDTTILTLLPGRTYGFWATKADGSTILYGRLTVTGAPQDITSALLPAGNGSGSGTPAFSAITSGTNTTATMNVGTGASLQATGTGVLSATNGDFSGVGPPTNPCTANQIYTNTSNGQFYSCSGTTWFLAGGGSIANPIAALPVGTDSGVTNAYVITTVPTFSPVIGSAFVALLAHANTGATTMNVNGGGVKNLLPETTPNSAHPFTGGEFNTVTQYLFFFDGTQWLAANSFPGFPTGSGNGADYTQNINLPPDKAISLLSRAQDAADQSRSLLNFYCPQKTTGCNAGQQMHIGYDGDGVLTFGNGGSGTKIAFLIGQTFETFDLFDFLGNGQANQAYLAKFSPNAAQTSGNVIQSLNPDGSNMWTTTATSNILIGANNCTNASPAVCGKK